MLRTKQTRMTDPTAPDRLLAELRRAFDEGTLVKLTFSRPCSADASLRAVLIRPVALRVGRRLSFTFRHRTRDVIQNLTLEEAVSRVRELLGSDLRAAHLFTTELSARLEWSGDRALRLALGKPAHAAPPPVQHDRAKARLIDPHRSRWLHGLGVTTADGRVCSEMAAKFRQINKFAEVLQHLLRELPPPDRGGLKLVDMGSGKGYLTFAAYELLERAGWRDAEVRGFEQRAELVELCNRVARTSSFERLRFEAGSIADAAFGPAGVVVALHACDTATDDALARGVQAGAALLLVAPCCHKELRPQLRPPPALAEAFRHGILRERQAEFVTDALRAALLEWAGYRTKVFEFVSTEHTNKNLMIAAVRRRAAGPRAPHAEHVRALAAFYGIRSQRLARQLGFELAPAEEDRRNP